MPKLYRGAAVRAAEQVAMARFGLDEDDLMARAGLAAWRLLLDRWPQAQRIGIVCGPGNNGGDGYVLAELARSSGRHVFVLRLGDDVKAGAARRAADAYMLAGGEVATLVVDEGCRRPMSGSMRCSASVCIAPWKALLRMSWPRSIVIIRRRCCRSTCPRAWMPIAAITMALRCAPPSP